MSCSISLAGHRTFLLDNLLTNGLQVAELSLGNVLSLDRAEDLLDALLVLRFIERRFLEAKVLKIPTPQLSSEPAPEGFNRVELGPAWPCLPH